MIRKPNISDIGNLLMSLAAVTTICYYAWNGVKAAIVILGGILIFVMASVTFFRRQP